MMKSHSNNILNDNILPKSGAPYRGASVFSCQEDFERRSIKHGYEILRERFDNLSPKVE